MRDLAEGYDAPVAALIVSRVREQAEILTGLADDFGRDPPVDTATLAGLLAGVRDAVAAFLVGRPSGSVLDDARALEAGFTVRDERSR